MAAAFPDSSLPPVPPFPFAQPQHEKIIRGVAVGLALVQYGREEAAETLLEQMTSELVRALEERGTCPGGCHPCHDAVLESAFRSNRLSPLRCTPCHPC